MASNVPVWAATAQYANLITVKRDGTKVSTPVWFALDGEKLYMYSNLNAGKMKRVRNNPAVEVGQCDVRGKPIGETVSAHAIELPESQGKYVHGLLDRKYGWKKRLMNIGTAVPEFLHLRKPKPDGFIEVSFAN